MDLKEYKKIALEIKEIYQEIDLNMRNFLIKNQIGCSTACGGRCCGSFDVMVSPVDLIPLAIESIEKDEFILDKVNEHLNNYCMYWINGKCSIYENRATLCRMFGVCSVYDKNHDEIHSICRNIDRKELKESPPNLVDYSLRINSLVPSWDTKVLPFNKALKYAIEKIFNSIYFYAEENIE